MNINFRWLLVFSILASIPVAVPFTYFLVAVKGWRGKEVIAYAVALNFGVFLLFATTLSYFEIIDAHPWGIVVFAIPLLFVSFGFATLTRVLFLRRLP